MVKDERLKSRWNKLVVLLSDRFSEGEPIDLDGIIYLIGLQELGQIDKKFKKNEKLDLMHIAICKLLEPYGYYTLDFVDESGWPHYQLEKPLPFLKSGEQSLLMKEAIVQYFLSTNMID